jgi:predicted ABC-type ATPase
MQLQEGPYDQHTYKAIFMAGIPGSGKTTISKTIFAGTGLKVVDFDDIAKKLNKPVTDPKIQTIHDKKVELFIKNGLGLLIDKTSQNYAPISKLKQQLESNGYQTMMIYVNTDLAVARERIKNRYKETGRDVSDEYLDIAFKNLLNNLGKYQKDFGRNFIIVDNSEPANLDYVEKRVNKFLNKI